MPLSTPTPRRPSARRADIDGLRVLAVLLVVIYHVWLGRVSGGVDVFLMISAFFLTGSLAKRAAAGTALKLGTFWAQRFRRLLPAAAVTLLGVLFVAYYLYPPATWPRIWSETWASLLYVQNWQLAFSEVDYYARDAASTSPLQHFWSLSVQGQVFIMWPILIGLVALAFRRRREWILGALIVVFGLVFAASLAFSIVETHNEQAFAYFDTRTRLWEFAAGSLLALLLPYIRMPAWIAAVMGWVGIAGLFLCGIVIDVRGGFPGYLALWPVTATALIVISGTGGGRGGPARLLSTRPFQWLSGDAYSLYLVHWPILITWMLVADVSHVSIGEGLVIIVASMVLARILARTVERPLHRSPWLDRSVGRSIMVIAVCIGVVGGATASWQITEERRADDLLESIAAADHPGAAQIGVDTVLGDPALPMIPLPTELSAEWSAVGEPCEGRLVPTSPLLQESCNQSPIAANAAKTVLIIGDSHAQQLGVPLIAVAADHDIGVLTLLKGGCTVGLTEPSRSAGGPPCDEWLAASLEYSAEIEPDAVYVIVTRADANAEERLLEGVRDTLARFRDAGIPVIAVRDNPRFNDDMFTCATERPAEDCTVPQPDVLAMQNPAHTLARDIEPRVILVDFTPWLCPGQQCQAVIGNIAVYMDDNHVSRAYGLTLAPFLGEILEEADMLVGGAVRPAGH